MNTNNHFEIPEAIREQKHVLRFNKNGEFRILVLSDIHGYPPAPCEQTVTAINAMVEHEKPDLVLFCGDNIKGCESEEQLRNAIAVMVGYLEEHRIPWAHVYGNHDDERYKEGDRRRQTLPRREQTEVYASFPYCMSKQGPAHIKGSSNYVLPVYSSDESRSDAVFNVWGMDSGAYIDDEGIAGKQSVLSYTMYRGRANGDDAYMPFTQIQWYFNTSLEIEAYAGHKVPGMMFFHIPLQEFYEVSLNPEDTGMTGKKREIVCAGPVNSGLFAAMVERGDIKAVCCGHDHINDYAGTFCGITLAYVSNVGYETYHDESMMGGRTLVIREAEPDKIETYMTYLRDLGICFEGGQEK